MKLIPAIDILNGELVQLTHDDFDSPNVFEFTPLGAAQHWVESGASRLHVVNLEAARSGRRGGDEVLTELANVLDVSIQASGGISDVDTAETLINLGASFAVFDAVAIGDPSVAREAVERLGAARVIAGVRARSGIVSGCKGDSGSSISAVDIFAGWTDHGVTQFLYADVDRDGTLEGPNIPLLKEIRSSVDGELAVAGGIGTAEHVRSIAAAGADSVVLGTSIYKGSIDFKSTLQEFQQ